MATLQLYREPVFWVDRVRAYTLLVDGEARGRIGQGETLEIELAPGDRIVQMQIDWATSRELVVDGSCDVALRCRANANPLLALLYITIWRHDYIRLERA